MDKPTAVDTGLAAIEDAIRTHEQALISVITTDGAEAVFSAAYRRSAERLAQLRAERSRLARARRKFRLSAAKRSILQLLLPRGRA